LVSLRARASQLIPKTHTMGCNGSKSKQVETIAVSTAANGGLDKEKRMARKENADFSNAVAFLAKVPLFKLLPKDEHPLLAGAVTQIEFKKGQKVIKQGEAGEDFYVIRQGAASVCVSEGGGAPRVVAKLKIGDYFGENALLRDEPRSATITADTNLVTFQITRFKFQGLRLHEKLQFANRKAVAGGGAQNIQTKPPSPKTEEERALMKKAILGNAKLKAVVSLDDSSIEAMIDIAWKEEVSSGTELITEGDLGADFFYIVQEGSFRISVSEAHEEKSAEVAVANDEVKVVSTVAKGDSFGELALLYLNPRGATVTAAEKSVVWVMDRQNFKQLLMKVSQKTMAEYVTYLSRVSLLNNLLSAEVTALAKALVEMHFKEGEAVLTQGEPGNTFYILYDGAVSVVKDGKEISKLTASIKDRTAQFFGEQALLGGEFRAASVLVTSEAAKVLALSRSDFEALLGPLKELMQMTETDDRRGSMLKRQGAVKVTQTTQRILRSDLDRIGLLGCGGFGVVELYEHKITGKSYAMKGLSKGYVVKAGMQESIMNEKTILLMTGSPFIIKLYATYNGAQSLYFLLEPALGGELYATYNRKGFHGSDKHAKFYVAGVIFAFEHLHERRIIYRDLKPENVLLNEKGQTKLADMGLAKFVIGKTFTTCGTPDYFAPELIASAGHTNAVDWWTLGVLIFELMSGRPPFESSSPMQIYSKVMKGISKVPFPPKCQGRVADLIRCLLEREPSQRLPVRPGGSENIKKHSWYTGFDWVAAKNQTMEVPFQPIVRSPKDIANFSARKEDMPRMIEYVPEEGSNWDKDFATDD